MNDKEFFICNWVFAICSEIPSFSIAYASRDHVVLQSYCNKEIISYTGIYSNETFV